MKQAFLVAGLLFGDEGKGATTDYLCRKHGASLIVRYNGGPQNGHNVITPDRRHHTFAQFGSGSFVPGVYTYISQHMLFDPRAAVAEAKVLAVAGVDRIFDRVSIHPETVIVTPYHQAMNRLLEISRGKDAHGSCGLGVGQARLDSIQFPDNVLRARHLLCRNETLAKLRFIEELHTAEIRELANRILAMKEYDSWMESELLQAFCWFDGGNSRETLWADYADFPRQTILRTPNSQLLLFNMHETVVFEGSQGVLLDEENMDFYPNVTWTDTTFNNALEMIGYAHLDDVEVIRIGCVRPYITRHGAGSMPNECTTLGEMLSESHNVTEKFQGSFRIGWLDLPLLKASIAYLGGVDEIALSCLDRLADLPNLKVTTKGGFYRSFINPGHLDVQGIFIDWLQIALNVPVSILGYGPTAADRQERMAFLNEKAA